MGNCCAPNDAEQLARRADTTTGASQSQLKTDNHVAETSASSQHTSAPAPVSAPSSPEPSKSEKKVELSQISPSIIDNGRTGSMIVRSIKADPVIGRYLKRVPLLSKLTDDERDKLGGAVIEVGIEDGQMVFDQGSKADGFYVIKEGAAVVVHMNEDSRQEHELARLGPGDYFGETALLTNAPRGASVQAAGPLVCFFLDKIKFRALFTEERLHVQFAKRRAAISAEQTYGTGVRATLGSPEAKRTPMSEETRRLVQHAVENNILFENLDHTTREQVVTAMWKVDIKRGDTAIREGEPGNNFYVVESGAFDVFVVDKDGGGQQIKVASRGPGTCFGELALMYNAPRAATVVATVDSTVYCVDRYTFRRITQRLGEDRLRQHVDFMQGVELLAPLAEYEREKIAEALEEVEYDPGAVVFEQGAEGDALYLVAEGEAVVTQKDADGKDVEILRCKKGDFFGERALLTSEPRAATVRALDRLYLLRLDRNAFKLLLGPLEDIMKKRVEGYDTQRKEDELPTELKHEFQGLEDFKVLGTLGKGSFGLVQLVRHKDTGTIYALKSVSKTQIVETRQQGHIMSEKRVMIVMAKCPFAIKLFATFKTRDKLYFLLEPSMGGELFTVLRKNKLFPEATARFYAASVLLAFEFMHSKDIIYRDLKPENLLLDQEGFVKVTDFGFAKRIKAKTWTLCGTPEYLAPEIVAGKGHGKGVDWWTLGILIFEMLASYTPFYHEDHMKMYQKITRGKINFPQHFSKEAKDLLKGLLQVVPTKRLGVIQGGATLIKQHPWFDGFDWQALIERRMKSPIIPKLKSQLDMSNFDDYSAIQEENIPYVDDGTGWEKDF